MDTDIMREDLVDDASVIETLREEFEAAATHGYSDEAVEVFTWIDGEAPDVRDRLLMAVMMATPDTLAHRQIELYCWYCDQVRTVARKKF